MSIHGQSNNHELARLQIDSTVQRLTPNHIVAIWKTRRSGAHISTVWTEPLSDVKYRGYPDKSLKKVCLVKSVTSNSHAFNRVIAHLRASNHLLSHENVNEPQTKDASHIQITLQRQHTYKYSNVLQIIDTNALHIVVTIPNGLLQNKKVN